MKKVLWLGAVILSIVFLFLSLAGIVGVWVARAASQQLVNDVFDAADRALAQSSVKVAEVIDRRQALQDRLAELSAEIDKAANQVEDTAVILMGIDRLLDGKLVPALDQLDQISRQVYTDLADLDAAINSLNEISLFRSEDVLEGLSLVLDRLLSELEDLDSDFQSLEVTLRERKADRIEALITPAQVLIARLDTRMTEAQVRWQYLQGVMERLDLRLDTARANLLRLITLLSILLTAVLAWLAISQYIVARYALGVYRQPPVMPATVADDSAVLPGVEDSQPEAPV